MPCRSPTAHCYYSDVWLIMQLLLCVSQPPLSILDHARSGGRADTSALMFCHSTSDFQLCSVPSVPDLPGDPAVGRLPSQGTSCSPLLMSYINNMI